MQAADLLTRLDRVKKSTSRRNSWLCRCPAHDDRGPSLSITETDDGRILLHCFAGCDVSEITAAIGLTVDDLFPPRPVQANYGQPQRKALMPASDALRLVAYEALIITTCASDLARGKTLSSADHERLLQAASNISDAMRLAGVTP